MKKLFYTDQYVLPLPEGHRFPIQKYRMLRQLLAEDGRFLFGPAPLADGWGGNLAGGTHHAFRSEGSGFCVFNDIAVAIRWLQKSGTVQRAAVVDLDVHQGDGTAQIFRDDPQVLTASVHCEVNFPFRKQQSKLDVALPEGTGDDDYLAAIEPVLERVVEFKPEIVFYQAGVDVLASDTLGKLKPSAEGVRRRDERAISGMKGAGVPLVITIGGGYSKPIEPTAQAHAATFRTAADLCETIADSA